MTTCFLLGCIAGVAAVLAAAWAIGADRLGNFLLALADALERTQWPPAGSQAEAVEVRPLIVAELVRMGYSHGEAEQAVTQTARGPRRPAAWRARAIKAARAAR